MNSIQKKENIHSTRNMETWKFSYSMITLSLVINIIIVIIMKTRDKKAKLPQKTFRTPIKYRTNFSTSLRGSPIRGWLTHIRYRNIFNFITFKYYN